MGDPGHRPARRHRTHGPITGRALTGILARRYDAAAVNAATPSHKDRPTPRLPDTPMGQRPGRDEHAELDKLREQADEAADELNTRILQLLADLYQPGGSATDPEVW